MNNNKVQRGCNPAPRRFWILGAGRFGRIAIRRIRRHLPETAISVVDNAPSEAFAGDIRMIREDGISWLGRTLTPASAVEMVVPAIPVHVAAGWLRYKLSPLAEIRPFDIPDDWLHRLPNAIRVGSGQVVVSHADFICPDNCPEPERFCTHTGKPRPTELFRLLADFDPDGLLPIVTRSHQILPGVGGILPSDLFTAVETITHSMHMHRPIMIATACRCHGVLDCMRLTGRERY